MITRMIRVAALAVVCSMAGVAPMAWAQDGEGGVPCTDSDYSHFDFWIGTWKVTDPDGVYQGSNRVEKILGGCVVKESWTGAKGMTGQSFNIYAHGRGGWHQTWVDSNGTLLLLDGGLEDGRMVLRGETPAKDGDGTVQHEISWQPMGSGQVRQVWRVSRDDGDSWSEAFVGVYTREDH